MLRDMPRKRGHARWLSSCAAASALLITVVSLAAASLTAREKSKASANDMVVARGCVTGGTLTVVSGDDTDTTGPRSSTQTYRISGPKRLVQQLRKEHEGHFEEVTGRVKGEVAPPNVVRRKQVGKVGIVVGAAPGDANPNTARVPEMPSIEVETYRHLEDRCPQQ
jgi:hypothetical protein